MLQTDQQFPGIDSKKADLQKNPDGSITVYFGPQAPEGKASNWVQTLPKKSFNVMYRMYSPLEPWFDKNWKLGDFEAVKYGRWSADLDWCDSEVLGGFAQRCAKWFRLPFTMYLHLAEIGIMWWSLLPNKIPAIQPIQASSLTIQTIKNHYEQTLIALAIVWYYLLIQ